MYKICVYVPKKFVENVKQALFDTGAGRIGNYDSCCWQTNGTGQFRPLDGSNPTLGVVNNLEFVQETKIELVCENKLIKQVVQAIKKSHPYEEPAFDIWKLEEV